MSAEVKLFKTKRDMTFADVKELINAPGVDAAILIAHTQDGYWHIAQSVEPGSVTSIETVGILEMVKQDVIDDYNRQQDP